MKTGDLIALLCVTLIVTLPGCFGQEAEDATREDATREENDNSSGIWDAIERFEVRFVASDVAAPVAVVDGCLHHGFAMPPGILFLDLELQVDGAGGVTLRLIDPAGDETVVEVPVQMVRPAAPVKEELARPQPGAWELVVEGRAAVDTTLHVALTFIGEGTPADIALQCLD